MFHFCTVDWLIDCCGFQRFCHSTNNQPGSCVCNRFQVSFNWLSNPFTWSVSEGSLESGGMTLSVTLRSRSCVWPDYQRSPTASKHWRILRWHFMWKDSMAFMSLASEVHVSDAYSRTDRTSVQSKQSRDNQFKVTCYLLQAQLPRWLLVRQNLWNPQQSISQSNNSAKTISILQCLEHLNLKLFY